VTSPKTRLSLFTSNAAKAATTNAFIAKADCFELISWLGVKLSLFPVDIFSSKSNSAETKGTRNKINAILPIMPVGNIDPKKEYTRIMIKIFLLKGAKKNKDKRVQKGGIS